MDHPITVVVEADDFPIGSDAEGSCIIQSAGKVNGREITSAQQKAVGNPGGIAEVADDLSAVVDPSGHRALHGARSVDGREIIRAQQKAVGISRRVHVGADDLVQVIYALKRCAGSARKVKDLEHSAV